MQPLYKMLAGWNLVLTLITSLLFSPASALWPFSFSSSPQVVDARSGGVDNVYADPNAKRIAIIGMPSYISRV